MKFITSLSVDRMNSESSQFWPHGVKRLVVIVWQPDPHRDVLLALGIDPDHGRDGQVVVEAEFPHARLSAFIKAVIDGHPGEFEHHCRKISTPPAHHHAVSDPGYLARKTSLALAVTIRADERLAEAVVNPSPPRRRPYDQAKGGDCK